MAVDPNARLRITADDDTRGAWNSALRTAQSGAKKIGGELKGLFAGALAGASIAGLQKLVTDALEYGDAVGKAATKSGLSTNAISELAFAAKGAGLELGDLSSALGKMQVNISKAQGGATNLQESFAEVGVSFQKFRNADPDAQFEALAEAINRVPEESDRARLATEIFGEAGAKLLPLFSQGAEGIRKAREEAVRLGLSLGPEEQAKLQEAGDAIGEMKEAVAGLGRELAIGLAPGLTDAAKQMKDLVAATSLASTKIGEFFDKVSDNKAAKVLKQAFTFAVNPLGTALKAGTQFGAKALLSAEAEDNSPTRGELEKKAEQERERAAIEGLLTTPRKPGEFGFSAEELRAASIKRNRPDRDSDRSRSQDDQFEQNIARYENQREILNQLDRDLAEQQEQIFSDNTEAIGEYLDEIDSEVLESLEVQRGIFEELGATIEGSLADAFFNASEGAKGFAEAVLNSFKRILADKAASQVTELLGSLFGEKKDPGVGGGSSGSSAGGFLSSVVGALFGGGKAQGGGVQAGMLYEVGEKGRELFAPQVNGRIIPNSDVRAMSGAGGSISITQTFQMNGTGNMSPAQMAAFGKQVSDQTVARIKDEKKRGKF